MKWRDFRKTELFYNADIVVCKRRGLEVLPRPFDHVIIGYPVVHPEYPHLKTVCVEFL